MENLNEIKLKLLQKICESEDFYLLSILLKKMDDKDINLIAEPASIYQNEKPIIEEEKTTLPDYVMKMIELGMDDMKNGRVYSEEEMDKMDEEWLK